MWSSCKGIIWIFVGLLQVSSILGYGSYRDEIPNGNNVPHPCKPDTMWEGVGHQKSAGNGVRNLFGLDFITAGHKWTKELCEKDSDGDGLTNGVELGDPACSWTKGSTILPTSNLSHPGVCEPWNSPKCQGQLTWLSDACKNQEFTCKALNETGIKKKTLQFPPVTVPRKETTYVCMEFELDTSDDYHLVATQALVNNTNVMHHAVLFGCQSNDHPIRSQPHLCNMVASRECQTIISLWTIGLSGDCFHDKVGFRIGSLGFKRVALQFHWNNPTLRRDYVDQSGMTIYYTNRKRDNEAGVWTVGSDSFQIPPRMAKTEVTGECPGACTSRFMTDKVYIVSATNHMHYLGIAQTVEIFRNGTKIIDITNDNNFNYDSPVTYNFPTPIEVLPGDTIATTCTYNSMNRSGVTYFGDATSSEMCFGFLTYYPRHNLVTPMCTSWESIPHCLVDGQTYKGCNIYGHNLSNENVTRMYTACLQGCSSECYELINNDPCMKGDVKEYLFMLWSFQDVGLQAIKILSQCDGNFTTTTHLNTNVTFETSGNTTTPFPTSTMSNTHVYPNVTFETSGNKTTPLAITSTYATYVTDENLKNSTTDASQVSSTSSDTYPDPENQASQLYVSFNLMFILCLVLLFK